MPSSDFRLTIGWRQHPKIKKLHRRCKADGVLGLVAIWEFCASQESPDGSLAKMNDEDIEIVTDYPGDIAEFIRTLVDIRLIDDDPDGLRVHNWVRRNPWAAGAAIRSEKARNAAATRWGAVPQQKRGSGGTANNMPRACPEHAPSNAPSNAPSMRVAYDEHASSNAKSGISNAKSKSSICPVSTSISNTNSTSESISTSNTSSETKTKEPTSDAERPPDVLDSNSALVVKSPDAPKHFVNEVQQVYGHWRNYHPRAKQDLAAGSVTYKAVRSRLAEGFTVSELCEAVDGCHKSPFHMGENKSGKTYTSLELICRNDAKVTEMREVAQAPVGPVLSEKERRGQRAGMSFIERVMQDE